MQGVEISHSYTPAFENTPIVPNLEVEVLQILEGVTQVVLEIERFET